MNTNFALLARFQTAVIELKKVCEEFFVIKPKTAEQKGAIFQYQHLNYDIQNAVQH